ncbi:hypothetical protein CF074_16120 [Clostridium botulinum]|nr:hypothetical protein [Clostridium botulinum]MBN3412573.1 hypothetical protein [Clostridium botulinum]
MLHEKSAYYQERGIVMASNKVVIKLKGHGSFHIREGWLRKGMRNVYQDSFIFGQDDVVDKLAVGSNMVLSIRYWLQAAGLTNEVIVKGGKRKQELTEGFGKVIYEKDPYFDDIFTLWLIHYKLVTNKEMATSWYLFFNKFRGTEFTKDEMYESIKNYLEFMNNGEKYSQKSLKDDCACILKTYFEEDKESFTPEDKMICPLSELEIIDKVLIGEKEYYVKKKPSMEKVDKLLVFYIIVDNLKDKKSLSINEILNDELNAGVILNLDRAILNEYLDSLKNEGYLNINRTSGLDKVYLNDKYLRLFEEDIEKLKENILNEYYHQ